ncbi:MAG: hypothetical protein L3J47_11395 [Sulfurovum sp.]|nr:hypothetical protein [Sulfurovum sp.]
MDDDLLYETLDGDDPFAEDKAKKEAIAHLESKEVKDLRQSRRHENVNRSKRS